MKWLLSFTLGVVAGLLYPRGEPTAKNEVEVNCPPAPACPAVECHDNGASKTISQHQSLLMRCYEQLDEDRKRLDDCREDVLSLKNDVDVYRNKTCPDNY
jgi:hypothetical protein